MAIVNLLGEVLADATLRLQQLARGDTVPADQVGTPIFGLRTDTDAATTTDGKASMVHIDEEGRLKVSSKTASFADVLGSTAAVSATVVCDVRRASNVTVHVKGGTVAATGHNYAFEASSDSTNGVDGTWYAIQMARTNANTVEITTGTLALAIGVGNAYAWEGSVNAYKWFRVRCTARTAGELAWIITRGSYATEPVPAIQTHPVTISSGTITTVSAATPVAATAYVVTTAASTNAALIKSSSGTLFALTVSNPTGTAVYVKLYNKNAAPTVGTDVPVMTIPVPANARVVEALGTLGVRFSTGIGIAVTAAMPATDTAAAVAGVQIMAAYL